MTVTPGFAAVMAHVLDAIDPASAPDRRDEAMDTALTLCPTATATAAVTFLQVVLDGMARQFGPDSAAHVLRQLTAQSVGLLDPAGDDR